MYYEINVSQANSLGQYSHFFATAERSLTTIDKCQFVYKALLKAFPAPQFKIDVTRWDKTGQEITF